MVGLKNKYTKLNSEVALNKSKNSDFYYSEVTSLPEDLFTCSKVCLTVLKKRSLVRKFWQNKFILPKFGKCKFSMPVSFNLGKIFCLTSLHSRYTSIWQMQVAPILQQNVKQTQFERRIYFEMKVKYCLFFFSSKDAR